MESIMSKNNAIKNAARARMEETGEPYAVARAAVVAEHEKPVYIEMWYEGRLGFDLESPEARKAWRKLIKDAGDDEDVIDVTSDEADDFAAQHLGNDILGLILNNVERNDVILRAVPDPDPDPDPYGMWMDDAQNLSEELKRTVTPEQVWFITPPMVEPGDDEYPDWDVLVEMTSKFLSVPATPETGAIHDVMAILDQCADVLATAEPPAVDPSDIGIGAFWVWSGPSGLLRTLIRDGIGRPDTKYGINGPVELQRISDIMRTAPARLGTSRCCIGASTSSSGISRRLPSRQWPPDQMSGASPVLQGRVGGSSKRPPGQR